MSLSRSPIAASLLALALLASTVAADARPVRLSSLPFPSLAPVERGEYRALDAKTGVELWRTRWTLSHDRADGGDVVHVREEGQGVRDASRGPIQWVVSMELALTSTSRRVSAIRELRDMAGALVQTQERYFDFATGSGRITTVKLPSRNATSKTFDLSVDAISPDLLSTRLRVLPTVPGQEVSFDLVTRDGRVVPMTARIVGQDKLVTPAGSFDCHKIELTVDGLLGAAAKLLLPKMYVWHSVAAPHIWVKYQGPDGGIGATEVVMELIAFAPPAR